MTEVSGCEICCVFAKVGAVNAEARRADNRIRLFQLPLERMV
jgi:hypothetical protein